jgi:uncharacterized protein (TIGR03437 family)
MRKAVYLLACMMTGVCLYAHTDGTPVGYAGVLNGIPTDGGGQTCIQCHVGPPPINQGQGRITVTTNAYTPGVNQDVTVQLNDPTALNFGFQLTARLQRDPSKQAGIFTSPTTGTQVRCAPDGHPAPCGDGVVQYVTHTSAQPPGGQGTRTYVITWTPPGRDLGPVIFYASGVAGSGEVVTDDTVTGDRVYTTPPAGLQVSPGQCNLPGPPSFKQTGAVTDAASFRNTISSGELISIFGSNFLPNTQTQGYSATSLDLEVNGNWPTELACIAVEITGVRVPIFFVSPGQINVQAPTFTTGQQADVKVILNPDTAGQLVSPVVNVPAIPIAPALFTYVNGNAKALDITKYLLDPKNLYLADTSVLASGVSAAPGDIIELYGTGFGPTNPAYDPGAFADPNAPLPFLTTSPVTVTIGNITVSGADVSYAGLSFAAPGLYQVNVKVPDVPDGAQPVSVHIGNTVTQGGVTIPVKR